MQYGLIDMLDPLMNLAAMAITFCVTGLGVMLVSSIVAENIDGKTNRTTFILPLSATAMFVGFITMQFLMALPNEIFDGAILDGFGTGLLITSILAWVLGAIGLVVGLIEVAANEEMTDFPRAEATN